MKYLWRLVLIYSSVHIAILHTLTANMTNIEEVNVCKMIMCFLYGTYTKKN